MLRRFLTTSIPPFVAVDVIGDAGRVRGQPGARVGGAPLGAVDRACRRRGGRPGLARAASLLLAAVAVTMIRTGLAAALGPAGRP